MWAYLELIYAVYSSAGSEFLFPLFSSTHRAESETQNRPPKANNSRPNLSLLLQIMLVTVSSMRNSCSCLPSSESLAPSQPETNPLLRRPSSR